MTAGPRDLYEAAEQFLNACNDALETTDGGRIDRAYVSPGVPAWDCCPQLTVHAGTAVQADTAPLQPTLQPMHRIHEGTVVPLVSLTATVLRCSPILGDTDQPVFPDPSEYAAASRETLADVWAIWNYLKARKRDGTLFPPDTREFVFDPAAPVAIEGGAAGWQVPIRVALYGYSA